MARAKKELGLDRYGVQKTMRFGDFLGDGVGQLSLAIINTLIGQLTYFYTEKVGMAAAVVATTILIPKIVDAFSDLIMGKIMDNSNSPKGKCRPWFLRMALPAALNIVLLFTVPQNVPVFLQVAYIFVTNTLISAVVYTAVAIPYNSILAMRTKSADERGTMGIVRTIFNMGGGMLISIFIIPITNALGGTQMSWIIFGAMMAVVVGGSLLISYFTAQETNTAGGETGELVADNEKDISFQQGFKMLLKNKFWVIMALTSIISSINYGILNGSIVYYAQYILGDDNLAATISGVSMLPTFAGFVIVPIMAKIWGMRNTSMIGFSLGIVGLVMRAVMPQNLIVCLIGTALSGFATMAFMCFQGPLLNNCVEYNEWKFGYRLVGLANSANSFAGKVSGAVGSSLIAWTLAIFGYVTGAAAASQPASVQTGVLTFSIYIPLVMFVVMLVLLKMFTLEKDYGRIVTELNERKAKEAKEG